MADEENTPLLVDEAPQEPQPEGQQADEAQTQDPNIVIFPPPSAYTYFQRPIKILNIISLNLSPLTFILLMTVVLLILAQKFHGSTYRTQEALTALGFLTALTTILSILNHFLVAPYRIPTLLNLLLSFVLGAYTLGWALETIGSPWGYPDDGWCEVYDPYPLPPGDGGRPHPVPSPRCLEILLVVKIIFGIALGGAVVVGLTHIVLSILYLTAGIKSLYTRPFASSLYIPTGSLTFEFTIKLLRQEPTQTRNPQTQNQEPLIDVEAQAEGSGSRT